MSAVADGAATFATIGDFVFRLLFLLTQNRVLGCQYGYTQQRS